MIKVVVIGGGNLAESLILAICNSRELSLEQIYLRSPQRGEELQGLCSASYTCDASQLAAADIYILAVSDGAISELSHSLNFAPNSVVVHTAGSTSIEAIAPTLNRGVLYPMQSFSRGRRVDFRSVPLFIEAQDSATLLLIERVANSLSQSVTTLDSHNRLKLHLGAVYVANFVNAMYIASEELLADANLPFDIYKPLIEEVTAKAISVTSPRTAQTGPAARGDKATIERHIAMLENREELQTIYKNISNYIWETLKKI